MFSDQTGNSYKLQGQVGQQSANRIRFHVDLPRTRQDFDGVIFTEGKAAITGTYTMQDRTFGFVAIREGASLNVDGDALEGTSATDDQHGKLTVELTSEGMRIEGKPVDTAILDLLREALQREPATWILLKVDPDRPYSEVRKVLESAREAGPVPVRLVPRIETR